MNRFLTHTIMAVLACLCLLSAGAAQGKLERGKDNVDVPEMGTGLTLHNVFQSNMVIQRGKPIRIWGWATACEKVTVTFAGQTTTTTTAEDRSWKVELPPQQANSKPQELSIQGQSAKITRDNILIGDVWLLGGQSNMEFEITKVENGQLEVVSANFDKIRLFTMPQLNGPKPRQSFPQMQQWSDWSSRHFRQGYWDICTPNTVRDMSAIGYVFARRLYMATQIPIGIIDTSRGGTCLETWTPLEVLQQIDTAEVKAQLTTWATKVAAFNPQQDLETRIKQFHERQARLKAQGKEPLPKATPPTDLLPGPAMDMNRPGNCYASMITPLAGFQIKGAVWHQGYNNALQPNGHALYQQVFPKMIAAWRAAFTDPKLPFGIISLCTEGDPQDSTDYLEKMANEGVYIREVQYKAFLDLYKAGDKNIGYASSDDFRRSWYHPQIKIPAGERIAKWALATQYGMANDIRWLPPMVKEVRVETGKIIVQFDSTVGPFHDGPIEGFAIAGKDGRFQPAKADWLTMLDKQNKPQQNRTTIVLTSALVREPQFFRHAWGRNPQANLKSTDHTDLPVPTLRTDPWIIADMYENYTGKKAITPTVLDGREQGELLKALRAEDLKRRLTEAAEFLKANSR